MKEARWDHKRLKYVCTVNPPPPRVPDEQEVTFVPMEAVEERGGIDTSARRLAGDVRQGYTGFRENDVLMAKITPCFENGKGSIAKGLLGGVGFGTTELHVLRATTCDSSWLFYVTQTHEFMSDGEGSMYGAGGQKRVSPDFVKDFRVPVPPLATQRAIADFLDRKTAAIDALIAKKERLIELLEEKRAALIKQAVTKGLDPNVPMKDSGIPWIGEIPAHWELWRLGHLGRIVRGASPRPAGDPKFFNGEALPWITVGEITKDEEIYLTATATRLTEAGVVQSRTIPKGTLLYTNSGATLGVPKITKITGCINDGSVAVLQLNPRRAIKLYLYYLLTSRTALVREQIKQGAGQPNLNTEIVREMPAPLPSIGEQRWIVEYLEERLARLGKTKCLLTQQLLLLREYRQSLITAAVTGQHDIEAVEGEAG